MAVRSRVWRVGKWAGVVTCILFVIIFAVSTQWHWGWHWESKRNGQPQCHLWIGVWSGGIEMVCGRLYDPVVSASWVFERREFQLKRAGWISHRTRGVNQWYTVINVPLWMPFLGVALLTTWIWYCDRRRIPAGHCCRCGYDLTKNESGVCPECGVEIEAKQVSA